MKNRIAGVLWLIVIVAGIWSFMIPFTLIVRGDAAATAANILASEQTYRLAFVANLVAAACYMGVTVILYDLLKPVNRTLSTLAAFSRLALVILPAGLLGEGALSVWLIVKGVSRTTALDAAVRSGRSSVPRATLG